MAGVYAVKTGMNTANMIDALLSWEWRHVAVTIFPLKRRTQGHTLTPGEKDHD
jgi:hypothetical protein